MAYCPGGGRLRQFFINVHKRRYSTVIMSAIPIHYDLEFEPNFDDFTFRGRARISVRCPDAISVLALDAADLVVDSCTILTSGTTLRAETNSKAETLHIRLPQEVSGDCVVDIGYTGTLNDRLLGFYRSRYTVDGKTMYLATTQFEPADARRAFPCWDRPDCKATFGVTIITPGNMTAISNMPVQRETRKKGRTVYKFKKTPIMSTYLLYLGVGNFEYLSDGGSIRIVTVPGKSHQGRYALGVTKKLLPEFEKYFAKPYPLPKLDLVALPDFAAGAMENWGAITFRESLLLYDENNSSTRTKQLIAEVISHELAHQWFGNLVTMQWWNDLWLNESFATFMATKILDVFHPEWNLWDQFVDDSINGAMTMDSLRSTHPIDVEVRSPSQVQEIFDAISYDKGGCVLRMLEDFVGPVTFRTGLRRYLRRFAYKNASGGDLWECMEGKNKPVRSMVEDWLSRPGFPIIKAERSGPDVVLKQERFRADGTESRRSIWPIPVRFRNGRRIRTHIMNERVATLESARSFTANPERTGFYRVLYKGELYSEIKSQIGRHRLSSKDSWGVQNDAFAFCVAGMVDIGDYLDLVSQYNHKHDYLPLMDVSRNMVLLLNMTGGRGWNARVAEVARPLFSGILKRLGWHPLERDPHTYAFLRGITVKALGYLGDQEVNMRSRGMTDSFYDHPSSVHPDMREPVFTVAAGPGGTKLHDMFVKLFLENQSIEEKLRILSGMCGFSSKAMLRKTLDFALSDAVRSQDMQLPVLRVAANPNGYGMLWPWLQQNWGKMEAKIGHGNPIFSRIIYGMAPALTQEQGMQIGDFFRKHPVPGTKRTLRQTQELVSIYEKFRARASQRDIDNVA